MRTSERSEAGHCNGKYRELHFEVDRTESCSAEFESNDFDPLYLVDDYSEEFINNQLNHVLFIRYLKVWVSPKNQDFTVSFESKNNLAVSIMANSG